MAKFHDDKIEYHTRQYQLALELNKENAAKYHKRERENYTEMLKQSEVP